MCDGEWDKTLASRRGFAPHFARSGEPFLQVPAMMEKLKAVLASGGAHLGDCAAAVADPGRGLAAW